MVAGTFHVPFAIQKRLVFEATALGECLLLCRDPPRSSAFPGRAAEPGNER